MFKGPGGRNLLKTDDLNIYSVIYAKGQKTVMHRYKLFK